jgi:hypothetical protein
MEEPRSYRFKISLRFRHPESDLSACSQEFGLEPSRQWLAGEERTSPRGNLLEGLWEESYWTYPLEIKPEEDIESSLVWIAQWLGGHEKFLAEHRRSGGAVALLIGIFLEGLNSGFLLEPLLIARYASLGIALEFDLYGADDSPHAA